MSKSSELFIPSRFATKKVNFAAVTGQAPPMFHLNTISASGNTRMLVYIIE